jgi:hypothetical protein
VSESREDYLFDGSGPADAEVQRLERLLAPFRAARSADWLAEASLARPEPGRRRAWLAAAGILVAVALGLWLRLAEGPSRPAVGQGWALSGVQGRSRLARGEWLSAGEHGAVLGVGELGSVALDPGARVRLDDEGVERHALYLEVGRVRAAIDARPEAFQIATPAGLSIDLGCVYDLEVDEAGAAELVVHTGQVAFEAAGASVFVPAGYATEVLPGARPLVPLPLGGDPAEGLFVRRLEGLAEVSAEDLSRVAGIEDPVVLYHLLRAPARALRAVALQALLERERLPPGLDAALVLEDPSLWRRWHSQGGLSFSTPW